MAEEDDASKTEDPTPKKLQKAREEGNVAQSQEVKGLGTMLGASVLVIMLTPGLMQDVHGALFKYIESSHAIRLDLLKMQSLLIDLSSEVGVALAPLLGMFVLIALAFNLGQVGLMWAPKKIMPKANKISPIAGFKKIFSAKSLVDFAKGIIKIGVVAAACYVVVAPIVEDLRVLAGVEPIVLLDRLGEIAALMVVVTIGVMLVVAVFDYAYQRHEFIKKMRMTKQEVKDENKQQEGDPHVKSRLRQIRMKRAQERMMANMARASVVVTNPTHYACALEYNMEDMMAPKLVAKGVDNVAARIRERADELEVPIVENPPLARALYASVELEEEIPHEHYKAVAEVIGYIMKLKGNL